MFSAPTAPLRIYRFQFSVPPDGTRQPRMVRADELITIGDYWTDPIDHVRFDALGAVGLTPSQAFALGYPSKTVFWTLRE